MNTTRKIEDIELFLFDMDGTIYLGDELIKGAKDKLYELKSMGKKVVFLTNNSSKSAVKYYEKLEKLSIKGFDVYTSGMAMCEYLNKNHKGESVYLVGNESLKKEFISSGISLTEELPKIVVLGYDTELTYEKLVKLTRYISLGAKFFATHPDINCPNETVYVPDVGSFLALIKASTNLEPSAILGKPYKFMGDTIVDKYKVDRSKIAMIGDRLSTDILFAKNNDFLSILVLSGETKLQDAKNSEIKPDIILDDISQIL